MKLLRHMIESLMRAPPTRLDTVIAVGGISMQQELSGVVVPKDWIYDAATQHYVPPNVYLDHLGSS